MEKKFDNYIVFLLGADNFDICKLIRDKAKKENCIDVMFEICKDIAEQFEKYDKKHIEKNQYENFEKFLIKYEDEIIAYIEEDKNFII